jgi:hypothetical protein
MVGRWRGRGLFRLKFDQRDDHGDHGSEHDFSMLPMLIIPMNKFR